MLSEKPDQLDVTVCDFDGVVFRLTISTPGTLRVSMAIKCFSELKQYNVQNLLQQIYGKMLVQQPEKGYDVSIDVDLTQLASNEGEYHAHLC